MVRVVEEARRCVVFLGYPAGTKTDPNAITVAGTGFLIYCGEGAWRGAYLVTAAHVARTLGADPFVIRLNESHRGSRLEHVDNVRWFFHERDETVDVALMRYELPDGTDCVVLPVEEFVDPRRLKDWKVGPGDAVYLAGLFQMHEGKRRNLPVVHSGNIALMPSDEKIPVEDKAGRSVEVEAYLAEFNALPGASGSPVFVSPTIRFMAKDLDDNEESLAIAEARDFLLGVWIAAWPGHPEKKFAFAKGISQDSWIPVGMGLVVPADRIIEILGRSDLIAESREAMKAESAAR